MWTTTCLRTLPGTAMLLLLAFRAPAQSGPQPPCGDEPVPAYTYADDPPASKLWSKVGLGRDWKPPACTGWTTLGFTTLVTTAARFRSSDGMDDMLRHIGAISTMSGIRYWSTTHQAWSTLIPQAYALTGETGTRRADFTPAEIRRGGVLYLVQEDNLTGKGTYRMHFAEVSEDRIVFNVENVGTLRYLFLPIFHAGEMQTVYFLQREPDNLWRFYSILRTGLNSSSLTTSNESSAINRAVAFYRWIAGIPSDRDPPAAR